jgi:heme/copper-type cytochrome/quinol oxidase subunit 2
MDAAGVVVLVVFILVIVVVIAYRVGYLWAQVEFLSHNQMLEAKWRMLPMNAPMVPRWRRMAGWAAYMVSALLLCLFLALAYWYAYSWGWTYLLAAWILWFAIFLGVLWLAEWCWRSGREVQTAESEEHPE